MFREPLDALVLVIVGIKPLPLLKIESSFGHIGKRILLLGLCRCKVDITIIFLGLLLFLFLLSRLLFLCWLLLLGSFLFLLPLTTELGKLLGIKLGHLGGKLNIAEHSLCVRLVDCGGEPPC